MAGSDCVMKHCCEFKTGMPGFGVHGRRPLSEKLHQDEGVESVCTNYHQNPSHPRIAKATRASHTTPTHRATQEGPDWAESDS